MTNTHCNLPMPHLCPRRVAAGKWAFLLRFALVSCVFLLCRARRLTDPESDAGSEDDDSEDLMKTYFKDYIPNAYLDNLEPDGLDDKESSFAGQAAAARYARTPFLRSCTGVPRVLKPLGLRSKTVRYSRVCNFRSRGSSWLPHKVSGGS